MEEKRYAAIAAAAAALMILLAAGTAAVVKSDRTGQVATGLPAATAEPSAAMKAGL